jgi:ubiquinone/menaquinone biosynthesis C-methylase UbiE
MKHQREPEPGNGSLLRTYFDLVYNPVYDLVTAKFATYGRLQSVCVEKFEFHDGDRVLCAGVGTGNEVIQVLGIGKNINVVGVDYSDSALNKAYKKALAWGEKIDVRHMDVQRLEFASGSFDKVLCLHVMDWVEDDNRATAEIIRVLKNGGQFVITYPSDKEDLGLGLSVLRDSIRSNGNSGKLGMLYSILSSAVVGGIVYLPLLFRPKRRAYSRRELESVFSILTEGNFGIEEYPVYSDLIIYGRK